MLSRLTTTRIALLAVAVLGAVAASQFGERLDDRTSRVVADLHESQATLKADLKANLHDLQGAKGATDRFFAEVDGAMSDMSQSSDRDEQIFAEAMRLHMSDVAAAVREWQAVLQELNECGLLQPELLDSPEAFSDRHDILDRYAEGTHRYRTFYANVQHAMEERLKVLPADHVLVTNALSGARKARERQEAAMARVFAAHDNYATVLRETLTLLEKQAGTWSLDDGQLAFEDSSVVEPYNLLHGRVMDAEQEIEDAATHLIGLL